LPGPAIFLLVTMIVAYTALRRLFPLTRRLLGSSAVTSDPVLFAGVALIYIAYSLSIVIGQIATTAKLKSLVPSE
jgi:hypothetical protein